MEKLILIKLGGSVITDKAKPFYAEEKVIARLGREILQAQKQFKGKLIISHGSGSFGHTVATKYKTHQGLVNKNSLKGLSETADAASRINRIVTKNLKLQGLNVVSFAPASFIISKGGKLAKFFSEPIALCLKVGGIPLVYGDVVMDGEKGFTIFSAEKVIEALVEGLLGKYKILKIIQCGATEGVYDSKGKTIPRITPNSFRKLEAQIGGAFGPDVTGGMYHKVKQSLKIASKFGIKTQIISGVGNGTLKEAILGKEVRGTEIAS